MDEIFNLGGGKSERLSAALKYIVFSTLPFIVAGLFQAGLILILIGFAFKIENIWNLLIEFMSLIAFELLKDPKLLLVLISLCIALSIALLSSAYYHAYATLSFSKKLVLKIRSPFGIREFSYEFSDLKRIKIYPNKEVRLHVLHRILPIHNFNTDPERHKLFLKDLKARCPSIKLIYISQIGVLLRTALRLTIFFSILLVPIFLGYSFGKYSREMSSISFSRFFLDIAFANLTTITTILILFVLPPSLLSMWKKRNKDHEKYMD